MAQNAEASTSRLPRSIATRRKSQDALKNTPNLTSPSSATFSTFTTKGGGTVRSVRTVPRESARVYAQGKTDTVAGAAFEPPTPPTPESELAPAGPSHSRQPTAGTSSTAGTGTAKRRRAPRVRYESDSSDGSGDAETSDEEAPWWTFTHRGMAKMRARTMRGGEEGVPGMSGVSGAESGKESIKGLGRRRASRQNSKEKDKKGTPASSIRNVKRPDTSTMRQKSFPTQSALLWRRSFGKENPAAPISLNISAIPPPMLRSSSAPSSPLPPCEPGSPGMTTMVGSSEGSRLNESVVLASPDPAVKADRGDHRPKRQLTAPAFPRFLKRNEQDVHTDTETMGAMAPRAKQREKQRSHGPGPESSSRLSENEGLSEPSRPKASRLQTARLMKISLPEPITQHFAEGWQRGWPHAGTWQDAYYGNYPDHAGMPHDEGHNAQSPGNDAGHTSSRKSSLNQEKRGGGRRKSKGQDRYGTPDHTDRSMPNSPAMDRMEADLAKKKTRRMRSRRYRHAIAPPTPSGLGFKPHDSQRKGGAWDEGHAGEPQGFDWGNDTARNRGRTIEETDELSRSVTRVTMNEKAMAPSDGKRWWWIFSRQKGVQGGREDVGAGKKLRRMLFLDARVTIYIRLINLAFVVTSLGESSRDRILHSLTSSSGSTHPSSA